MQIAEMGASALSVQLFWREEIRWWTLFMQLIELEENMSVICEGSL